MKWKISEIYIVLVGRGLYNIEMHVLHRGTRVLRVSTPLHPKQMREIGAYTYICVYI